MLNTNHIALRSFIYLLIFVQVSCDQNESSDTQQSRLTSEEVAEAKIAFEGNFALQVITTTEQELPVIGLSRSTSIAKKLVKVRETNGQFFMEETFCEIEMSTEGPASPSVPTDLVNHIPSIESQFIIEKRESTWYWERPKGGIILGANLDHILTDDLPSSPDDESVWDQDMDGHPGITLTVSGLIEGDIYTVIRYVDTLSGRVENNRWVGHTEDETEQVIIDASQEVLLLNITPRVIDDPSLNTVVAYPIDEGADCIAVLARLEQDETSNETLPTAEITSPSSTDFPMYAERVEAPPERPVPEEGAESLWWDAFHSGEIERVHEAIIALDQALEADPENYQLLFARIGANTWLLSTAQQEGWAPETFIEESTKAIPLSQRAFEVRGEDGRVLAFIGTSYVMTGEALGDDDLIDQGWAFLEQGVSEWPEVVLFTWGMNMHGRLSATDPLYQIALDSVYESIRLCFGEVDRDHPSVEGLTLIDSEWTRRACISNDIAPHSNEGFWLTAGDLFLKAGEVELSRTLYHNAKLSPSYDTWSYQSLIDERIDQAFEFAERWSDDDPSNDPIDYGADTPCKLCHQK